MEIFLNSNLGKFFSVVINGSVVGKKKFHVIKRSVASTEFFWLSEVGGGNKG